MLKNIYLLLFLFIGFNIKAKNDSLDYKIKFYLGYNSTFTYVKYYENSSSELGQRGGTYLLFSEYNYKTNIPPVYLPEFDLDFQLPKHFKIILGFFKNKFSFTTPVISSTGENINYACYSSNKPPVDSVTTYFYPGPTYQTKVNLSFLGFSLGTGYTFKKKRFYFDLDAGLKILILQSTNNVTQIYNFNKNYYNFPDTASYTLGNATEHSIGQPKNTNFAAYYLKGSISYRILQRIYFSISASYTNSFTPLHGISYGSNLYYYQTYTYSFSMQQFAVHAGFSIKIY